MLRVAASEETRMKFRNRVVLVTGGSQGLGKGMAAAFLAEGAKVVVNGRNAERLAQCVTDLRERLDPLAAAAGAEVLGLVGDIADSTAVGQLFEQLLAKFGTLDVLVNNAAITPTDERARAEHMALMTTPIAKHSLHVTSQLSDEDWLRMINTNLNGLFYCTRAALQIMEPRGYGKIVNIASIAGISGLSCHSPHYSASKGGMVAFTRSVALEVIGGGINVNCIAAGAVSNDNWNNLLARGGEALQSQVTQAIPAGRAGTINEYASLALYLASDDAAYLVGQVISPNGGVVT
jgi:3-oxoacyl-[acyl-carrier protein] reductase